MTDPLHDSRTIKKGRPAVTCPDCNGTGTQRGVFHLNRGDAPHQWVDSVPCLRCGTSGIVPDEMADWIVRGEAARRRRISQGISMRARAEQLGVSPAVLSAMENGRRDPALIDETGGRA